LLDGSTCSSTASATAKDICKRPIDKEFEAAKVSSNIRELMKPAGFNRRVSRIPVADANDRELRRLVGRNGIIISESMVALGPKKVDRLGDEITLAHSSALNDGVVLGDTIFTSKAVVMGDGTVFCRGVVLGNGVVLSNGVVLGGVVLGDGVVPDKGVVLGDGNQQAMSLRPMVFGDSDPPMRP
jgi:hypothetical protein